MKKSTIWLIVVFSLLTLVLACGCLGACLPNSNTPRSVDTTPTSTSTKDIGLISKSPSPQNTNSKLPEPTLLPSEEPSNTNVDNNSSIDNDSSSNDDYNQGPVEVYEPKPKNVYYKNCSAARSAGAAPVRRGDPGYGKHLDRDGDGIGCE